MSQLFNLVTVGGAVLKIHLPSQETQETWVRSLGREDPWRRKWQPTPIFLPESSMDREVWWATVHGVAKS